MTATDEAEPGFVVLEDSVSEQRWCSQGSLGRDVVPKNAEFRRVVVATCWHIHQCELTVIHCTRSFHPIVLFPVADSGVLGPTADRCS